MRIGIALRAFFAALGSPQIAEKFGRILKDHASPTGLMDVSESVDPDSADVTPVEKDSERSHAPTPVSRDSAVSLLATLQREARLVDLIQEDLSQFSDAQIGAAARPCLTQCRNALDRLMQLKPVLSAQEGETITIEENASPVRFQWIGEGSATSGRVVHHGWEASRVELPAWAGEPSDAAIIAAAQLQSV